MDNLSLQSIRAGKPSSIMPAVNSGLIRGLKIKKNTVRITFVHSLHVFRFISLLSSPDDISS